MDALHVSLIQGSPSQAGWERAWALVEQHTGAPKALREDRGLLASGLFATADLLWQDLQAQAPRAADWFD